MPVHPDTTILQSRKGLEPAVLLLNNLQGSQEFGPSTTQRAAAVGEKVWTRTELGRGPPKGVGSGHA